VERGPYLNDPDRPPPRFRDPPVVGTLLLRGNLCAWQASLVGHAVSCGGNLFVGQAFQPAAGLRAGLGALYPLLSAQPNAVPCRGGPACRPPVEHAAKIAMPVSPWSAQSCVPHRPLCGACRQACHAGGHAGRAIQSRTVREFQRRPARTTARSTSGRRRKVEQAGRLATPAALCRWLAPDLPPPCCTAASSCGPGSLYEAGSSHGPALLCGAGCFHRAGRFLWGGHSCLRPAFLSAFTRRPSSSPVARPRTSVALGLIRDFSAGALPRLAA